MRGHLSFRFSTLLFALLLLVPTSSWMIAHAEDAPAHPILSIGSVAPNFCLPGIDGKNHCLKDYASAKILVIAFTCNHCPAAQLYEQRIMRLVDDYKDKGVTLVAIEPNNPNAVRLDELG